MIEELWKNASILQIIEWKFFLIWKNNFQRILLFKEPKCFSDCVS